MMKIHNKQFIICKDSIKIEGWKHINLGSYILSYDENLMLIETYNKFNEKWILVGNAIQTNPKKLQPNEEIFNINRSNFQDICSSWTGRWILINENTIILDASGSLGCFYTINTEQLYISSSPALIKEVLDKNGIECKEENINFKRGEGMDYYPARLTRYSNIKRLIASQILKFENKIEIIPRRLFDVDKYKLLTYEEKIKLLSQYFSQAIINLSNNTKKEIYIPLTAGMDSRLILSVALNNNINFKCITFEQKNMIKADKIIPKKICKKLGISYKFSKVESSYSEKRKNEFDYHCSKHCIDADRDLYSNGQFDISDNEIILLRGGIFETARLSYYYKLLTENEANTPEETIINAYNLDNIPKMKEAIKEWNEWIELNPEHEIDWKHRYYLEVRVGSWLSYLEHADDITNTERLHLANCSNILSLMLSIPIEKRANGQHQIDLINLMEPKLMKFKINNKTFMEKLVGRLKMIL